MLFFFDANSNYFYIKIVGKEKYKTAFTSHYVRYRFARLRFDLTSVPCIFQEAKVVILDTVKWQSASINLHDNEIFFKKPEENTLCVEEVLSLLRNAVGMVKIEKGCFLTGTKLFCRRRKLRPRRLRIGFHSADTIKESKHLCNLTENRLFSEVSYAFRRVFLNISRVGALHYFELQKG